MVFLGESATIRARIDSGIESLEDEEEGLYANGIWIVTQPLESVTGEFGGRQAEMIRLMKVLGEMSACGWIV